MLIPHDKVKPVYHKFLFLSKIYTNTPKCWELSDNAAAVCAAVIGPFIRRHRSASRS